MKCEMESVDKEKLRVNFIVDDEFTAQYDYNVQLHEKAIAALGITGRGLEYHEEFNVTGVEVFYTPLLPAIPGLQEIHEREERSLIVSRHPATIKLLQKYLQLGILLEGNFTEETYKMIKSKEIKFVVGNIPLDIAEGLCDRNIDFYAVLFNYPPRGEELSEADFATAGMRIRQFAVLSGKVYEHLRNAAYQGG